MTENVTRISNLIRSVSVRLGEYNTATDKDCVNDGFEEICADDPPLDVPVQEQIPHEKYNPLDANQYNDIALLRLSSPVTFSSKTRKRSLLAMLTFYAILRVHPANLLPDQRG